MKTFLCSLLLASALALAPLARADHHQDHKDHKVVHDHKHKHAKNCGHKAEKHGDHTDYEENVDGKLHHHKKHGKHYDECEGPAHEGAKEAEKK